MRKRPRSTGQSLVEFAYTIPILVLLLTVFLDLGRAVFYYSTLTHSVREGSRYAMIYPNNTPADETAIIDIVKNYSVGINTDNVTIAVTNPDEAHISVSAAYTFVPVTPGLSFILGSGGGTLSLSSQSTMQIAPSSR